MIQAKTSVLEQVIVIVDWLEEENLVFEVFGVVLSVRAKNEEVADQELVEDYFYVTIFFGAENWQVEDGCDKNLLV